MNLYFSILILRNYFHGLILCYSNSLDKNSNLQVIFPPSLSFSSLNFGWLDSDFPSCSIFIMEITVLVYIDYLIIHKYFDTISSFIYI